MVDFEDLISYIKMKFFKNVFLNYRESQHLKFWNRIRILLEKSSDILKSNIPNC